TGRDRVRRLSGYRSGLRVTRRWDLACALVLGEGPPLDRAGRRRPVPGADVRVAPLTAARREPVRPELRRRRRDAAPTLGLRRLPSDPTDEALWSRVVPDVRLL